jgi:preprotein translocase subunit SecA
LDLRGQTEPFLVGIIDKCAAVYARKCAMLGGKCAHLLARIIMLQTIDEHWCDHLLEIDELRDGIFLRGYGQLDPLVEFQCEASLIFEEMMTGIYRGIFEKIYQATLSQDQAIAGSLARASQFHETIH